MATRAQLTALSTDVYIPSLANEVVVPGWASILADQGGEDEAGGLGFHWP
jgi:hypothetical protein